MATGRELADTGSQQALGTLDQSLKIGTAVYGRRAFFTGAVATNVLTLPAASKAAYGLKAFATAGTTAGEKAFVGPGATLAAGQCQVDGLGNIAFFGTDAVTAADVYYGTLEGDTITEQGPVVSEVLTFSGAKRAQELLSATIDTGTTTGAMTVEIRGATPTTGEAALIEDGTGIEFAAADAAAVATVTYRVVPGVGNASASLEETLDADFPST